MLMVDAIVKSGGNMLAEGSMVIALDESRLLGGHKAVVKVADNIISPWERPRKRIMPQSRPESRH